MALELAGEDSITAFNDDSETRGVIKSSFKNIRTFEENAVGKVKRFFTIRIYRITLTHLIILIIWVSFLLKYTSYYNEMYAKNALVATLFMNSILFGISDCLAQSITCFFSGPLDPVPKIVDDTARHIMNQFRSPAHESLDLENGYESDTLSVFNDYGLSPASSSIGNEEGFLPSEEEVGTTRTYLFNFRRFFSFMFWGFFISFFQVPWYKILNFFYTEDPTVIQVLERVLSDQLTYSPVQLYFFFMYANYIMEGGNAETFATKIKSIYISTLGCNYLVWPAVQFINFLLLPKPFQVPFSSSVGVLWNCFLSMRNASKSVNSA
ncbi:hypothetical protein NCAS_0B00680 [Naumovozyma castellii]|uniref:Uncharacterized protein n=1 Tax=Naumovozyma castellii TaxID=27288 RepID=G0VB29_NAUCA|nr:hypothetical protein NCAS_0B00680 [Naumovozyma castellii CBS 4309]CCC68152.1 hypothetical protein NCAS_0B00680 [Naumovozyma castellii CBS 4309]